MKPSESGAPELGEAVPMQHAPPDMTCDSAACSDPKLDITITTITIVYLL